VGADAQVLTADSTQALGLKWANSASGFANPMTAVGDLIAGGTAGSATKTAIGSAGQVLTVAAGVPAWVALPAAAPAAAGVIAVDQAQPSGLATALTLPRYGAGGGVATLGGDLLLPSAHTFVAAGTAAEAGRWAKAGTPIMAAVQTWEAHNAMGEGTFLYESGMFRCWYAAGWSVAAIGYASCPGASDPTVAANWTKYASNPIMGQGHGGEAAGAARNCTIRVGTGYRMYYGQTDSGGQAGAWMVSTSADGITGWSTPAVCLAAGVVGWSIGWANAQVWYDAPANQWYALIEGRATTSGPWQIALARSADGLTGWVLDATTWLTTLQVAAGGSYGGPYMVRPQQIDGLYHMWYHAVAANALLPTDIYHATSVNLLTWTIVGSAPVLTRTGEVTGTDQVADPSILEARGKTYLFYSVANNTAGSGNQNVASFAGSLHQLVAGAPLAGQANGAATLGTDGILTAAQRFPIPFYGPIGNGTTAPMILNANNQIILSRRG